MRFILPARSLLLVACAAMTALPMTPAAHAAKPEKSCEADPVTTRLDERKAKALTDWLKQPTGEPVPMSFKVPGNALTSTVCHFDYTGLQCVAKIDVIRCPTQVEVQVAGGGSTVVGVECTGPDSAGQCDCEFEERS